MAQVTTGIRSVLSLAFAYDFFQDLLGARRSRQRIAQDYLRLHPGQTLLDVGCGTCAILDFISPGVRYIGVDLSESYILSARQRYGVRGEFHCRDVAMMPAQDAGSVDVALAVGLLHHLDDAQVYALLMAVGKVLRPGGRFVSIDPCYDDSQSCIARFFIARDRGLNVRTGEGYRALAESQFGVARLTVRHDLSRIPYTHAILECMN